MDSDKDAVEVGVRFRADVDGSITGVRFYKYSTNTDTHVGNLWTNTGTRLATATFTNETASGWQQVSFASPVAITANTTYVASYHTKVGRYGVSSGYFATTGYDRAPLHALKTGVDGPNGVYRYSLTSTFPNQTYESDNYWVDVVFVPSAPSDTTPPTVTSVSPATGATGVGVGSNASATFSEAMTASTITGSTVELRDPAAALVSAAVTYDSASRTVTIDPAADLAYSTTYTATVKGGATDPRVKDLAGNALASTYTWSFTTGAAPVPPSSTCPCSIWSSAITPAGADGDTNAVEVGVKFRADSNGSITGLRFYKFSTNTGTHVGHLWSRTGTLLASATFSGETDSGWQQVTLASPVAMTANTTYIASYHTSVGRYAVNSQYFATSGVDNAPLHALASGIDGGDGVYAYGPSGTFPVDTYNSANYWVDVVFSTSAGSGSDTTPPKVYAVTPAAGATGVGTTTVVTATFTEMMSSATINTTTFELRDPLGNLVPASVTPGGETPTATLTPNVLLAPATTYTATVKGGPSGVKDLAGNAMTSDFVWSFTTAPALPSAGACPCSIWSSAATPAGADPDTNAVEIGVKFRADNDGYITGLRFYKFSTNTGTHVGHLWTRSGTLLATATFIGETASGWQQVTLASPVPITANTTYIASYHAPAGRYAVNSQYFATSGVDNPPLHALANGVDGGQGVYGYGPSGTFPVDTYNAENYWVDVVFTPGVATSDTPPSSPILIVTSPANPYSSYYAEILRAEGLNAFDVTDLSSISAVTLTAYDVVILGEMPLTSAQVTMFSDWVNAGGNLISMRPDKALAGLLGLMDQGFTLENGYMLTDGSTAPGAGIVTQTMQFHGAADLYLLNSATSVATLYSAPDTPTPHPAVTLNSVGPSGGEAAAFTYDLARSVVYTRQGNPAWSGADRDGFAPVRTNDLFYGASTADLQPDWIDFNKIAIPQADEQQRLLTNLILHMNRDRTPLPRFWYFPRGKKAVVVLTSDEHGMGGWTGRFDSYKAASPAGCSVANWECVRGTAYVFTSTPIPDTSAAAYNAEGFEIGLHVNTNCADWTPTSLEAFYTDQLNAFAAAFPSLPAPTTNRAHCSPWSDYATHSKVELGHRIRLDTNYYYWPGSWVMDIPGFFTGSGIPMRFVDANGALLDVYQATTQVTDESGQNYPFTIDALLDKALGPEGYYGVFTANMQADYVDSSGSDAIVASAQARGVPVVAARQLLAWLDGRNASSFRAFSWVGNTLSFSIEVGTGGDGLQGMLPTTMAAGSLATLTVNGTPVPFTRQTIKGIDYAIFTAAIGNYQATYAP